MSQEALDKAREALGILEEQAAGYTALTIPVHLKIELEEKRTEVSQLEAAQVALSETSPYQGLRFFDVGDADLFFGREALTAQLVGRLRRERILAVVGASGSGKSSVVRAGMVPALASSEPLADGSLPPEGSAQWPVHFILPGEHPLESLAVALTRDSESVTAAMTLMDDMRKDVRSLHLYVRRLVQRGAKDKGTRDRGGEYKGGECLLLVIDQFEEVFTACKDADERKALVDNLIYATEQEGGPTSVVLTLRADFYSHCAQYEGLRRMLEQHQAYIGAMAADELRRAIEEPARKGGWELETGLAELLLREVGNEPGALPLLSHALLETWKRREGRKLTLAGYAAAGGVQGAIASTAERVYQEMDVAQQAMAKDIFLRLTELGEGTQETRRRAALDEFIRLPEKQAQVEAALKKLVEARLVTTGEQSVEVAHEALIHAWPRLQSWLDTDRQGLLVQRHLTESAKEWERLGRDVAELYHGARLAGALEWVAEHPDELNVLERSFLDASEAEAKREEAEKEAQRQHELEQAKKLLNTQRQRAIFLAVGLVIAVILIAIALQLNQQANTNLHGVETAEVQSAANANTAQAMSTLAHLNAGTAQAASTLALRNAGTAQAANTVAADKIIVAATAQVYAEQEAKNARGGELSAQALNQLDKQFDLALLLSAEAFKTADNMQTRQALFTAWQYHPQLSRFLQAHTDSVGCVAWSADGRLASGSGDGKIIIWDLESGQPAQILDGSAAILSLTWSLDGRLASGLHGGEIIVWDLESGQPGQILYGGTSLAWSADGRLAAGSDDGTVIVWNLENGQPGQILEGHTKSVTSVAWSADGRLASGSDDGKVIVWDLESGQPALTLVGHTEWVSSVAWSADGRLASGSGDGKIIVWDSESGQAVQTLEGHPEVWISSVAWSVGGKLASGLSDGAVIVWDLDSGQPALTLAGQAECVYSVAWSADGRLASGSFDGKVILWNVEREQPTLTLEGPTNGVSSMAWSKDGRLATGSDDGTVIVWDAKNGQPVQTLEGLTGVITSMAWSADGRLAAGTLDGKIIVWDLQGGKPAMPLEGHISEVSSVTWSAEERLASGSADGKVIVWDLESGQPAQTLEVMDSISIVTWSPDGRLAFVSWNGPVTVWDVESGQPAQTLDDLTGSPTGIAWSADGRLAAGSMDGKVIVWDLESGQPALTLDDLTDPVSCIAWSDYGQLAVGSLYGKVIEWNLEKGQPAMTLSGHTDRVSGVVWSADGRLASGSTDGTLIIWDLESGQPAQTFEEQFYISDVAWLADGRLAVVMGFGTIHIWETDPQVYVAQNCERAGRNLTEPEWQQYIPWKPYEKTCAQWP